MFLSEPEPLCGRLAAPGYRLPMRLTVSGETGAESGWVMDFGDLKAQFQPLLEQLDHYYLNDIEGLENPTSENLAKWIWQQLKPELEGLSKIIVQETCNAGCIYYG